MRKFLILCRCLIVLFCFWHGTVYAHKPSDSYLMMTVKGPAISGQWDIALRDLDYAISLDSDSDSAITWQEVLSKKNEIDAYVLARLTLLTNNRPCPTQPLALLIDHHTDGAYAVIKFNARCAQDIDTFTIRYSLFSDLDPSHRGLLKLQSAGLQSKASHADGLTHQVKTAIFSPEHALQSFQLGRPDRTAEIKGYLSEGIWHIWQGYDHILFLLSLLLPAVLIYTAQGWRPAEHFTAAFFDVLKVVTAFTLAHSLTLTLATLQVVTLPSRLVESAIAASVMLAALNNLYPSLLKRRWLAAFAFGLIHGFGFAAVLADLGLQQGALVVALLGFNVGVEIGQLAILCMFIPFTYAIRRTWLYQYVIVYAGSVVILLVAGIWLIERAFNLSLLQTMQHWLA